MADSFKRGHAKVERGMSGAYSVSFSLEFVNETVDGSALVAEAHRVFQELERQYPATSKAKDKDAG